MKRSTVLFLGFLVISVLVLMSTSHVYGIGHYGIPGTLNGCDVCHDFVNGYYDDPSSGNLRWVKSGIEWPEGTIHSPVKFTKFSSLTDPNGTMADGNDSMLDGPCEVCHTNTHFHTNFGDGTEHFDGQNCVSCHPHFADDIINYFEPRFTGTQSHVTHWTDPKGPLLGEGTCTICHYPNDFSKFGPTGVPIADTDVCDPCHSPDGAFDGIDDPIVGAKPNWEDGIYEANGTDLKSGKDNWCATCHDDGTSVVSAVSAPNVMGDNATYGYNVSGHGDYTVKCDGCHDLSLPHTDGDSRTYSASSGNYKEGYRLCGDMAIPRDGELSPVSFSLCFNNCHIYSDIFGEDKTTNFRDENRGLQYHQLHLDSTAGFACWDSDWNNTIDSGLSCTACHNVHGSPTPVMTRHGELISTPGTTNKVPALNFRWYMNDGTTQTSVLSESRYGVLQGGGGPGVFSNYVCVYCHPNNDILYYRIPGGGPGVKVINVWTSDLNNMIKNVFGVGEDIRCHVSFQIFGPGLYFVKTIRAKIKSTSGTVWERKLKMSDTLSAGTYEWIWDKTIPAAATPGSSAKVIIPIGIFDVPGGTLLGKDKKVSTFSISP